jgi:hypothetical protein
MLDMREHAEIPARGFGRTAGRNVLRGALGVLSCRLCFYAILKVT